MPYVELPQQNKGGNPFKEIPNSEDPKSVHLLWKGTHSYIVMNKYPYNCGHLLVVPYREIADISDLSPEERVEFFDAIVRAKEILQKGLSPDAFNVGFNLGAGAGAGIPSHLHCHVVPRWNGDTNFMPVISDTRVLPEAMDALWEKLKKYV
jgi:ATP adenylyltransferase